MGCPHEKIVPLGDVQICTSCDAVSFAGSHFQKMSNVLPGETHWIFSANSRLKGVENHQWPSKAPIEVYNRKTRKPI